MSKSYSHLLLTRFNVSFSAWNSGRPPDTNWLYHRFWLFDTFCYPSIRGQTNQNFRWLVLFARDTPRVFQERIQQYAQWSSFRPYFVDDLEAFYNQGLADAIRANINSESDYLITTRLDNDDALSTDYVQSIQDCFSAQEFEFINVPHGYVLAMQTTKPAKLYYKEEYSNSFVSLIEAPVSGVYRTIWTCGEHDRLRFLGKVSQVTSTARWLQIVHGRNITNSVGLAQRIPLRTIDNVFRINYSFEDTDESSFAIMAENLAGTILGQFAHSRAVCSRYLQKTKAVLRAHSDAGT